ncbi:MAG: sensor domain-containing diguanylate cyclase [Leptospira sp.]|nr:sensor domain-containing diguanylate cyclase [Leptospira sp.]
MSIPSDKSPIEQVLKIQTELTTAKPDVPLLLDLIAMHAKEITQSQSSVFELVEDGDLVYRAVCGAAKNLIGIRLPIANSFSGLSLQKKEILICKDSEIDERVNREACRLVGLRSMVVVPLYFETEILGVLKVFSSQPNFYSTETSNILKLLSGTMAALLFNAFRWAEREKSFQSMAYLASHDALTGIYNRSAFYDHLRRGLSRIQTEKLTLSLAIIDLDGLKSVNDTYGHRAGDFFISRFASRFGKYIHDQDIFARLGGDEFALITISSDSFEAITNFILDALRLTEGKINFETTELFLKASIGISFFPIDGIDPESLVAIADSRMYENKRENKKN